MGRIRLKHISICGADESVEPSALRDLYDIAASPNMEFGIYVTEAAKKLGTRTYPTRTWRTAMAALLPRGALSAHVFKSSLLKLAVGDTDTMDELAAYGRIQLNMYSKMMVDELFCANLIGALQELKRQNPVSVIFAHSTATAPFFPRFQETLDAALFDHSRGQGIEATEFPAPLPGVLCGYAGGLKPENIDERLDKIAQYADGHTIWIDAESGFRDRDNFDKFSPLRAQELVKKANAHPAVTA